MGIWNIQVQCGLAAERTKHGRSAVVGRPLGKMQTSQPFQTCEEPVDVSELG